VKPSSSEREVFLVGIATTDYLDALFDQEFASCGAAAVFAHLDAARHRWDVCDLHQLRPQSFLLGAPSRCTASFRSTATAAPASYKCCGTA
jgi:hypothetical protein